MKDKTRQIVNVAATILVLAVNGLANALPLNGQMTGEISDRFQVYFVPAGYVFSIWGLIYLALIAFTIYQALPAQRETPALQRIGLLYAASSVANVAWLFLWHYERFPLTMLAMLILLGTLIALYMRVGIGRVQVGPAQRWLVHVPFSIYLGWITVATIANATTVLTDLNWNGWGIGPQAWAVIMMLAATAIAWLMSLTRGDIAYALVLVWALAGIAVKHAATPLVAISAGVAAALVVASLPVGVPRARRRPPTQYE
jgi:benzodiazapine receptor